MPARQRIRQPQMLHRKRTPIRSVLLRGRLLHSALQGGTFQCCGCGFFRAAPEGTFS